MKPFFRTPLSIGINLTTHVSLAVVWGLPKVDDYSEYGMRVHSVRVFGLVFGVAISDD